MEDGFNTTQNELRDITEEQRRQGDDYLNTFQTEQKRQEDNLIREQKRQGKHMKAWQCVLFIPIYGCCGAMLYYTKKIWTLYSSSVLWVKVAVALLAFALVTGLVTVAGILISAAMASSDTTTITGETTRQKVLKKH